MSVYINTFLKGNVILCLFLTNLHIVVLVCLSGEEIRETPQADTRNLREYDLRELKSKRWQQKENDEEKWTLS
jgi:hypothetical protein